MRGIRQSRSTAPTIPSWRDHLPLNAARPARSIDTRHISRRLDGGLESSHVIRNRAVDSRTLRIGVVRVIIHSGINLSFNWLPHRLREGGRRMTINDALVRRK